MTDRRTWMGGGGGGISYSKGYRRLTDAEMRREIHGIKPKPVEVAEPVPEVPEVAVPEVSASPIPAKLSAPKAPKEPKPRQADLTQRRAFALYYAVDPEKNAARAARCAGYRPSNARNTGSRLLAEDYHVMMAVTEWGNRIVQIEEARRAVERDKYGGQL